MSDYVDTGYCDTGYIESDTTSTPIFLETIDDKVDYLVTSVNSILTILSTLATKTDITTMTSDIDLLSLNGSGSEFKDGVAVTIFGRDTVYTVERSFMSLYSDNGYTVHYDLVSEDGYKCTVPEALLTKHTAAV